MLPLGALDAAGDALLVPLGLIFTAIGTALGLHGTPADTLNLLWVHF